MAGLIGWSSSAGDITCCKRAGQWASGLWREAICGVVRCQLSVGETGQSALPAIVRRAWVDNFVQVERVLFHRCPFSSKWDERLGTFVFIDDLPEFSFYMDLSHETFIGY